jgi:DNA-binding transcriptional ArsR family regulator
MVNYSPSATLDATFSALSDPTRRAMLERLFHGESTVMQLAEPFEVSLPAISRHLSVLERAGLVTRQKDGRIRRCRLEAGPMRQASDWIAQYRRFWDHQLDALADYLEEMPPDTPSDPTTT